MTDTSEINDNIANYSLSKSISDCASEFSSPFKIADIIGGLDDIKKQISKDFLAGKTAEDMEREDFDVFLSQASARNMSKSSFHIGLAYLRQAEDALVGGDMEKCSHMLAKANFYRGYLFCAESFYELELSKMEEGRRQGGAVRKKLLQEGRDEVVRLLEENKPPNGWMSYTQAAKKIVDDFNSYILINGNPSRADEKLGLLKVWMSKKNNSKPIFPDVYSAFWSNANDAKRKRKKVNLDDLIAFCVTKNKI